MKELQALNPELPGSSLKEDEVIALLRRARVLIEEGWTKGTYVRSVGGQRQVCLYGALAFAGERNPWELQSWASDIMNKASVRLETICYAIHKISATRFNDASSTKKEDVLALIDKAIG